MSDSRSKFQRLLRELFQFNCADLDFGIYRIMNYKREVIERFITEDLPKDIIEELERGALAEQSQATKELEAARTRVLDNLGEEALDAAGNLTEEYHATPAGKEYLAAQARAAGSRNCEALEATVYNHLYTFFSRYYQDGDFISKRRYSKKERYAIPYNGEEVYLYWANHDQYYIKTGEHFIDYTWKAPNGVAVHFKLKAANVEQNNSKGEKRFFIPRLDVLTWDADTRALTIPFEYRPLTGQEAIAYGNRNQQDKIVEEALPSILERLKGNTDVLAALSAERRPDDNSNPVSYLIHHLRQYTARNTRDFFIHKNLKGFLSRELDFYLKNEVLNLDEMEAAGEDLAEGWFQLMRLIKRVGIHIINFLAQIEDFQKMLWEKKKFVTETFYCITVGNIPHDFYPEIAACEAQWEEWQKLFSVETPEGEAERLEFLKVRPTLVLDTRHFSQDFMDCLLGCFENLDEVTDGLLVYGENWQALNLLAKKYRKEVKCIYIDPPFNSPSTEIVYKNDYKHSSWLSLLSERIELTSRLLSDGVYIIAIDENEQERLGLLLERSWLQDCKKVCVSIRHNPRGIQGKNFSYCHEYAYFLYPSDEKKYIGNVELDEPDVRNLRDSGSESDRSDARNCFYPFIVRDGIIVEIGDVPPDDFHPQGVNEDNPDGTISIWPIDTSGREKKWRYARQSVDRISNRLHVRETEGKYEIFFTKDTGTVRTLWLDAKFDASEYGTKLLQNLFGSNDLDFSYPKSLYTVLEAIRIGSTGVTSQYILDYFAGSGTTGHAVVNLNREDGGRRKFILVEMARYFDNVLLPRIKKVTFTPEWEDGRPRRLATTEEAERGPRIVKVIRVESYEDALNNIDFDESSVQQLLRFEDYLLQYMLRWETRMSETLLSVEKLTRPFSYRLHIHRDGETRVQPVDLPETFNYLIGLNVEMRRVYNDNGRRYLVFHGTTRKGRKTVLIWRETEDWTEEGCRRDREFVAEQKATEGVDDIYVNGDSLIPGAKALEPLFKACIFAEVEE